MTEIEERITQAIFQEMDIADGLDLAVAMRYARTAIAAMPGWQPIETAPTIGASLVYLPNEHRKFEVMYRMENASIVGGAFGFDRSAPSHWMPIPTSPAVEPKS